MDFNDSQLTAVKHKDGAMLVLAGPGSGKTTVITRRIQYLINEGGVEPSSILVITFTKAAATEMKERFYRLMESDKKNNTESDPKSNTEIKKSDTSLRYKSVSFGTFHAVFFTILKHAYNYSAKNIIREEDRYNIVKKLIINHHLDVEDENEFVQNVLGEISKVKSECLNLNNYYSVNCPAEDFREIYSEYIKTLKMNRLLDFDDMLVYTYELFTQRKDILKLWQDKYKYILIDEFQDINKIQYETIRMIAKPEDNLFIVGDDDQSIYGFRGSKPDIMLNFTKDYRKAKQVLLDFNYRSTPQIVNSALNVIGVNTKRFKKNIKTVNADGNPVKIVSCRDFIDEYNEIAQKIREMTSDQGKKYSDIAVLYRSTSGINSLARKLMEKNIPFMMKDTLPDIFEHWIAKDIFAYIRLAQKMGNRNDFIQIINKPKRYIGRDYLTDKEIDLDTLCKYYEEKPWMVERIEKLKEDLELVSNLNPFAAVNYIRRGIGYDEYLSEYALNHNIRFDELTDVINEIHESSREHNTFAEWEEAIRDTKNKLREKKNDDFECVTLTTMHSSKGLEYDTVFIVDMNEGVSPHKKAVIDSDIEEERRMFYVAMTRAKKELYIYYANEKYNKKLEPSRFLIEGNMGIDKKG